MRVLLVTPPAVQVNTPYPAMPVLCGFLKERGAEVSQVDFSLAVALEMFSAAGVSCAVAAAKKQRPRSACAKFLLANSESYLTHIKPVVAFLQGRSPEFAWSYCRRGVLPEGPHFRQLDDGGDENSLFDDFGGSGICDKAKLLCSLFLDDLSMIFRETVEPSFGLARYAEHLAVAAPRFDPILARLESDAPTYVDRLVDSLTAKALEERKPDVVGITIPFPGTVYGAFRVAAAVRRLAPKVKIAIGGGYVNTELLHLTDARVFRFVDYICYGEGFDPWLGIIGQGPLVRTRTIADFKDGFPPPASTGHACGGQYRVPVSNYDDLDFSKYLSLVESPNLGMRLWSDGHWIKVQLANGCYWHRCAFCDVSLDYIGRYSPAQAKQAVDAMLAMRDATGISAFHFTDEALAPALLRAVSRELLERRERLVWWGNIRLDTAFTAELCALMAESGCIGISAGLECANDRLLKLMNKGITCASARTVCTNLVDAGLLVHLYLMYGFPTETKQETLGALATVRDMFRDGLVHSAFWHRFALTVHSPIARQPELFGIQPDFPDLSERRFALNEISYREPKAPDHASLGEGLSLAVYNYMQGRGLDLPASFWFRKK